MSAPPYIRPMSNWWRRDPFFIAYMVREASAVLVGAYAIVLLVGLVRLAQGEAAWNSWLWALESPASLVFHAVALVMFLYHTWTWFRIMPKTMPLIFVGDKKLPEGVITGAGLVAALVASVGVFLFVQVTQ